MVLWAMLRNACLHLAGKSEFDIASMRELLDGHDIELRDKIYDLMRKSKLFHYKTVGDITYLQADYGDSLATQREITFERLLYFKEAGLFKDSLTNATPEQQLRTSAFFECLANFDHSASIKAGVHIHLW